HAAAFDPDLPSLFNMNTNYGKQSIYIFSAMILAVTILIVDAKFYSSFSPVLYAITMLLLIAVLVVGRNVGGNQAWIPIGSFRLQPSELAKFGTALLMARYISSFNPKLTTLWPVLIAMAIIMLPMALIMLQPDAGSMLVFLSFMFPLYREGLPGYLLIIFWGMVLLFILNLYLTSWILITIILVMGGLFIFFNKKKQ